MCVDVIVETSRGIVLTLRDIEPWKGQWHIPGGTVMYTESVEHAVKRVAKEEIGVNVAIQKLIGYTEYLNERKLRGWGTFYLSGIFGENQVWKALGEQAREEVWDIQKSTG